jgi:hypothetical protein
VVGGREGAREGGKMKRWRMFVMIIFMKGYLRLHKQDCEGHTVL